MFRIPTITKNLLIINVLMFFATWVFARQGVDLNNLFGLHFFLASDFSLYQLFTYMFMHANFTHILFNMFSLWMFGCVVENVSIILPAALAPASYSCWRSSASFTSWLPTRYRASASAT